MSYVKVCSSCDFENEENDRFCGKCGAELPEQTLQTQQLYSDNELTYSPSRTNNYTTTRLLSTTLKLLAWIFFVLVILSIVGAVYIYQTSYNYYNNYTLGIDFYLCIFALFVFLPMIPVFALMSEIINVLLDTEANTRQTTKTLERILRSQN